MEEKLRIYSFENHTPKIGDSCFIAPDAVILGNVSVGSNSSIWFGTILRGDINLISVGKETNIQDLSVLHVTEKDPCIIGNQVTIGHKAVLHGCRIEDNVLIGMGAIVMDNVLVGKNSLVAAGSVLPPGKKYPAYSLIQGIPGKVVRALTEKEIEEYGSHYKKYLKLKISYLKSQLN